MRILGGSPSVAARDEEINGQPPRIGPLADDELSEEAKAYCRELRATFGLAEDGVMPEVIATMLRHPGLYEAQMGMTIQIAARGAISGRERELAVLRIAWRVGAPYEWGEHVDIGQRFGVTSEEVARVIEGPDAPGWSRHDAALLRSVDELLDSCMISDETWATLAESWNEQQLIELPVLVGIYNGIAMQQNSLRVRLERGNPGLSRR